MKRSELDRAQPDNGISEFMAVRPRLHRLARRMLGSPYDADDALQDVWMRWQLTDRSTVANSEAWLVSVTARLCIDRLRSARRRRSRYVGPWLPEPRPVPAEDPVAAAEQADELGYGFLVLLERLGPMERAVLLLREGFGYGFDEIGVVVERSEAACRQLLSRARRKLGPTARCEPGVADLDVVARFLGALSTGDAVAALGLLAPGVVHLSDGGPHRRAARRPVIGPDRVTRLLLNLAKRLPHGAHMAFIRADDLAGVVAADPDGVPLTAVLLETDGPVVSAVYAIVEPGKLARLAAAAA